MTGQSPPVPLVVDVDGTLIKTDLLHEGIMQFLSRHPLQAWKLPLWLAGGKHKLKCNLAQAVELDVTNIPLREEMVDCIRAAQSEGREVFLASASEKHLVERLAEQIGGIAGVFGTDMQGNTAGERKREILNARFGEHGYDYAGDRPVDFAVWSSSRRVLAVSHGAGFSRKVTKLYPDAEILAEPRMDFSAFVRALRVHQWSKNVLLFLPLVAGHHFGLQEILVTLLAFLSFCCAASSAYIFNDLLDLPGDRAHPRKSRRPFAAGELSIAFGVVASPILMLAAIIVAMFLSFDFLQVLLGYVVLTLAYSLYFKRRLLIDVIVLAGLYVVRVFAGVAAVNDPPSPWLLMFSLFLFLSLATIKRCSELVAANVAGTQIAPGRGYQSSDAGVLFPLATAAGYGAVLVFALYISSPEVIALYAHPSRLWLICPLLLYWVSRALVLAHRDELHEDPVVFALKDRVSWIVAVLAAAVILVSI